MVTIQTKELFVKHALKRFKVACRTNIRAFVQQDTHKNNNDEIVTSK
jgi:hypothetical protein